MHMHGIVKAITEYAFGMIFYKGEDISTCHSRKSTNRKADYV